MANNKINKIKMPVSGTVTTLTIEDSNAVHQTVTINGDAISSTTTSATVTNLSLANTAITTAEVDKLF